MQSSRFIGECWHNVNPVQTFSAEQMRIDTPQGASVTTLSAQRAVM